MYKSYAKQKVHVTIGNKADIYDVLLWNEASTALFSRMLQNVVNYTRSSVIFFVQEETQKAIGELPSASVSKRVLVRSLSYGKSFYSHANDHLIYVWEKNSIWNCFALRFALEQAKDNSEIAY